MDARDLAFYGAALALVIVATLLVATRAFRGRRLTRTAPAWRLGQGWWTLWHRLLLSCFIAFAIGVAMAWAVDADHVFIAFVVLAASLAALLLMTLVNTVLWATRWYRSSWLTTYLAGPLLVVVAWLAVLALILVYQQVLVVFLFDAVAGPITAAFFMIALAGVNLCAVQGFHQRSAGERG